MSMDPATTTAAASSKPASATTAAQTAAPAAAKPDFTEKLDAELKRIASHATKIETLKNGAKLYHLSGGREVEAAPGKSPYVVAKGDWGETKTAPAQPETTAPAAPATTPPATTPPAAAATTPPAATTATPAATATPPATTGTK